jgi:hypothetical protein
MKRIPPEITEIRRNFDSRLAKKKLPARLRSECTKWLRYYLDFCEKYQFDPSDRKSLPHFLKKLQDKNQTERQRKQASYAISAHYETVISHSGNMKRKEKSDISLARKGDLKRTHANWKSVYNDLHAEIKLRDYSPKLRGHPL